MDIGGNLMLKSMSCPPDFGKEDQKSICCVYYYFHFVFLSAELMTIKGEGVGGLEERKPSWWRSVERTGRSYLSCSVYQLLLFQLLMTWCQSLSLKALMRNSNKGLFLPSVVISSSPLHFLICLFLEERWASQKSVHRHGTAAPKIISLCFCAASIWICNTECSQSAALVGQSKVLVGC